MAKDSKTVSRRRNPQGWRRRLTPYLFVAPNMLIFATFIIYPAIRGFFISFYDSQDGVDFTYVGTKNFKTIATDPNVALVAQHTVIYVVFYVLLSVVLSLTFAIVVNDQVFAKGFFRAILFMPVMLSPVVVGLIWGDILDRKAGPLNAMLQFFGGGAPGWLIESKLAMVSVIFVGVWVHLGFYSIILLAGLQGIDKSLLEAASMDGASKWQVTRRIVLPLLKPTAFVIIILSTIHGFQSFDFIYTLSGGGPAGATTLIVQYIYDQAFQFPIQYGIGTAASVVLFMIIFAFTAMNFLVGRKQDAV